ncbi:hypothetical protein ACGLHS_27710 [Variovorax sp. VaC1]|uniref:hypothetical protein n=1 Tax=Variovorax sp. VaC1 TaxID=3373132 RepID=UPI003747A104
MQLFADDPLPPGLWLVKWIDRFQLGHDSESPLALLNDDNVKELLGTRPRSPYASDPAPAQEPPMFVGRVIQAAYLPLLYVGDVIEGAGRVSRLPRKSRTVTLTGSTTIADQRIGAEIDAPPDWTVPTPFRVLNRFEYQLIGGIAGVQESRCLVFRHKKTEYILPKIVIFRAFYGLSSKMINALCSDAWIRSAKELISFNNYESGIFTGVDAATGTWNIVLQPGVPLHLAAPLALLWFDPHGRMQADSLYTDSLIQNNGKRGSEGRSWFASANIPHRSEPNPFKMIFQGFELRARKPSQPQEFERFLVTAITGSSWSLPDQVIMRESHTSNAIGEVQHPAEGNRPYRPGKPPVEGDPEALATSTSDPDADESINVFSLDSFAFLNEPKIDKQKKESSQKFGKPAPQTPSGAASLVSAGSPTYAGVAPAPADALERMRARSQQFEYLVHALEKLQGQGAIQGFPHVSSPACRAAPGCASLANRNQGL